MYAYSKIYGIKDIMLQQSTFGKWFFFVLIHISLSICLIYLIYKEIQAGGAYIQCYLHKLNYFYCNCMGVNTRVIY